MSISMLRYSLAQVNVLYCNVTVIQYQSCTANEIQYCTGYTLQYHIIGFVVEKMLSAHPAFYPVFREWTTQACSRPFDAFAIKRPPLPPAMRWGVARILDRLIRNRPINHRFCHFFVRLWRKLAYGGFLMTLITNIIEFCLSFDHLIKTRSINYRSCHFCAIHYRFCQLNWRNARQINTDAHRSMTMDACKLLVYIVIRCERVKLLSWHLQLWSVFSLGETCPKGISIRSGAANQNAACMHTHGKKRGQRP